MNIRSTAAFSLMEVVLALGIISFVLFSMLGLLSVGMNASRESSADTALTSMISQVLGKLRSLHPLPTETVPAFFFDEDGLPLTNSTGAIYKCEASTMMLTTPELPNISDNFIKVKLVFIWPASVAVPSNSQTVYASLLLQ